MSDERANLGLTLLSIASELAAVQHRREQIEDEEIIFRAEGRNADPLLRDGVSQTHLAELMRQGKIGNVPVWRRLRHPEKEDELRAEDARLLARAKELRELQTWIERELADLKTTEAA